jgi:hypothetical protein
VGYVYIVRVDYTCLHVYLKFFMILLMGYLFLLRLTFDVSIVICVIGD